MSGETEVFSNFISLGSACQTASSMEKYGLRGWSGPFDWLVTDSLQWVLHYMETDFADFLKKENITSYMLTTLIEKIEIDENQQVTIYYKFSPLNKLS